MRCTTNFRVLIAAAAFCFVWATMPVRNVHADVIASFQFTGNDYTADTENTIGANTGLNLGSNASSLTGVSVSSLQFSPQLDPLAALGFAADDYDDALGFSTDQNADRNFLTATQTVYFDVEVASDQRLDLESFQFETLKTRADNPRGSRLTYTLFVNPAGDPRVDGLAGDQDFVFNSAHDHFAVGEAGAESTGDNFTTGRASTGAIELKGFQGLTGKNTLAIRLYGSDGSDRDFGLDNLILRGSVSAIPEPGSVLVLLTISTVGFVRRQR